MAEWEWEWVRVSKREWGPKGSSLFPAIPHCSFSCSWQAIFNSIFHSWKELNPFILHRFLMRDVLPKHGQLDIKFDDWALLSQLKLNLITPGCTHGKSTGSNFICSAKTHDVQPLIFCQPWTMTSCDRYGNTRPANNYFLRFFQRWNQGYKCYFIKIEIRNFY